MIDASYANTIAKNGLSDKRKTELLQVAERTISDQANKGLFYTYFSVHSKFEKDFIEQELKKQGYEVGLDYQGSSSYNLVIRW